MENELEMDLTETVVSKSSSSSSFKDKFESFENEEQEFYQIISQITKNSSLSDCVKKESVNSRISTPTTLHRIALINNKKTDKAFTGESSPSQNDDSDIVMESLNFEKLSTPNIYNKEVESQTIVQSKKNIEPLTNEGEMLVSGIHLKESVNQESYRKMLFPESEQPNNTPDLRYNQVQKPEKDVCNI